MPILSRVYVCTSHVAASSLFPHTKTHVHPTHPLHPQTRSDQVWSTWRGPGQPGGASAYVGSLMGEPKPLFNVLTAILSNTTRRDAALRRAMAQLSWGLRWDGPRETLHSMDSWFKGRRAGEGDCRWYCEHQAAAWCVHSRFAESDDGTCFLFDSKEKDPLLAGDDGGWRGAVLKLDVSQSIFGAMEHPVMEQPLSRGCSAQANCSPRIPGNHPSLYALTSSRNGCDEVTLAD